MKIGTCETYELCLTEATTREVTVKFKEMFIHERGVGVFGFCCFF